MQLDAVTEKAKNFFEYLLTLNNLVGKVTRDFADFDKNWHLDELQKLNDCYVLNDCQNEDNILEIHRPDITEKDKQPPKPDKILTGWIDFNIFNENIHPSYIEEKIVIDSEGEGITETFSDNSERKSYYSKWIFEWNNWSDLLKEKKRVLKLYGEFFDLISCIEKEGESLEFIYGSGLLCWKHSDENVGTIRSPLLTVKLELDIDADRGIISAKQVDRVLSFEREIFSGIQIPNINQINQLIRNVQSREITNDLSDFFNQFIHLLDANGNYIEEPAMIKVDKDPMIFEHSMFSLRSKNVRVLRDDLEQIVSGISSGEIELSDTVTSILGEAKNNENRDSKRDIENGVEFSENNLYFPLESNEQQKEIINRIERNHGVTVQGPPGTGKTHTIANLVSHFLSEGKKILITSQKESPLKVLKNKIPKEIRDLCVPVLGGGRESLQEIEQSIRVIGEKLGELDVSRLEIEIKRNKEELNQSKRVEAQLKNQLKLYAEKEGTELHYNGEKLFKYDVAKRLSESTIDYSWIHDDIPIEGKFPLSTIDFKELWELKEQLTKESLQLKNQFLPIVDTHIQNNAAFSLFIENGQKLLPFDVVGREVIEKFDFPKNESSINQILTDFKGILNMSTILDNSKYNSIIADCKAGGVREKRWRNLLIDIESANEKMFEHYNNLVTHKINLPDKDLLTLKEDINIAKERLQSGKKPNLLFFMLKGKQVKYLFDTPILNDKPISSIEDIKPIEVYLQYMEIKKETVRIFNGNMEEIGHLNIDENEKRFPHLLEDRIKELKLVIQVVDRIEAVKEKMKSCNIGDLNFYSIEEIEQLINLIVNAIKHIQYQDWLEKYEKTLLQLRELEQQDYIHPILQELIQAFEMKDVSKWAQLLLSLQQLHRTKEIVNRFYELLNLINNKLPLSGKSIELTAGVKQDFPLDYLEAFELRKLQSWLDETKDMNIGIIKKQIDNEHKEQMRLIGGIVSKSTWKHQVERITDKEKRALSAWKTYIKRYGKGTSKKYAHIHLQGAREEMKTAQSAIPVWIMPINQVLENFPVTNEKFDVIIFDESSQCDLFSINVLLRGKKIIVVGDDEQISPQAIGTNLEDVYELVRRHLSGVPNAKLFDGNISLYEIAEQTFPKEGKLMLREHFRCVPEIIQFSNDLSYGGEMIPLRLPLEEEKIEPPVLAIKVNDGYNDEKDKDVNVPEADAIVADMLEMIQDPLYDDQTFGVITLQGQRQHKLLETRIREKIGDGEFVKRKVLCGNAYTLQGDERDIIFLSMVVAPNRNFRALTKTSEKQRYNVAASRAKNQMRLYHSIDLEELSTDDLRYRFLSYCKNPTRLNEELANLEVKCDSPFEIDVLRIILAKGYKVTPQVEVGRYRIDLVVEGLRDRLAVECDGEKWHGPEKFEEDMQRQESLERAGWMFWRVRGREFYFDRLKAMDSLWERLNKMGILPYNKDQESVSSNNLNAEIIKGKDCPAEQQDQKVPQTNYYAIRDNHSDILPSINANGVKNQQNFGVQTELFDSKLEGFQNQINLFEEDNIELFVPISDEHRIKRKESDTFSLYHYLKSEGYDVIDQREKGGSIWVIGAGNLQPLMENLERMKITFKFSPNGSRSTKKAPAWYSNYSG